MDAAVLLVDLPSLLLVIFLSRLRYLDVIIFILIFVFIFY